MRTCACLAWPGATKEDRDSSTRVYGRLPLRDKSDCDCRENAHAHARVDANDMNEQTGTWVNQVAQAMEEQLKKDEQELMTRERRKKAKDAQKIRGSVHENDQRKGTIHAHDEMAKLMRHEEQELVSLCGGGGLTTKAGGLTSSHARRKGPIKRGWAETDKGRTEKPNVRARSVAKEYKTHARPELYASTPPLEALRLVQLEIASGNRDGNEAGDDHMFWLLPYSLYGTRDAKQDWEKEIAATLSKFKLTRGMACPGVWQCRSRGEHVVATVQGDDHHHRWKAANCGTPHQDLENSKRTLNRVMERGRDGITGDADQRHVRESLKELHLLLGIERCLVSSLKIDVCALFCSARLALLLITSSHHCSWPL